ncbi:hypothetical protein V6C27_11120 [Peptococcaceae bacterium 1198_IL3148]
MFNSDLLINLESYARNNNHAMLYDTVLTMQNRLQRLLNICAIFVIGVAYLHSGLQLDAISKIGLLTGGSVIRWKEFTSYNWGEYYQDKATIGSYVGYYQLELASENSKLLTYILREKESRRTLKISAQDKDKVDKFLSSVIAN